MRRLNACATGDLRKDLDLTIKKLKALSIRSMAFEPEKSNDT
jgi:hypothetical protein